MQDTAGEVEMNTWATYSCGSLHMDRQRQNEQLEPTYNSSVLIQVVALKIFREQGTIETGGGRGLRRPVLATRHDNDNDDDDDDDDDAQNILVFLKIAYFL